MNKGLANLPYLEKLSRQINRRLLEVERVGHNSGLSGDSIQRVVQPTVADDGKKAPGLKFGQPRVMALLLARTLFQRLIDGFHNRDLRELVADLLGVSRPAAAVFTSNAAVLPFPLRQTLDWVDAQLDQLIYDAFPLPKAS